MRVKYNLPYENDRDAKIVRTSCENNRPSNFCMAPGQGLRRDPDFLPAISRVISRFLLASAQIAERPT